MALFTTRRAWLFDEKGEYHGKKGFAKNARTFKYADGAYNVDYLNSTMKKDFPIPFIWERRTYFYNRELSNPLKLDKKAEPPISPVLYNVNLETKVAKELNDLAKGGLMAFLTPKNIIMILVAIGVIYYSNN